MSRHYDDSRWSPRHATRAEERLHRRLGLGTPGEVAGEPGVYAAWRSALRRMAYKRLLKNLPLRLKGGLGQGAFVWRGLTIGESRFLLAGLGQHLLDLILRKPAQQFPQQGAVSDGFGHLEGREVAAVDHELCSSGRSRGAKAESGAGVIPPPAKGGDA